MTAFPPLSRPRVLLRVCAFQVKFLNVGLAKYDSMIVVRLYQSMLAMFSILSGYFYFDEVEGQSALSIGIFCLGMGIVLIGIAVGMLRKAGITNAAETKSEPDTPVVTPAPRSTPVNSAASPVSVLEVNLDSPNRDVSSVVTPVVIQVGACRTPLGEHPGPEHADVDSDDAPV